jgi:hypothetical protein
MDSYVQRGDELISIATARILHGYATVPVKRSWSG